MADNELFLARNCPACGGDSHLALVDMSIETLLQANPGYHEDWFRRGPLTPDVVCRYLRCESCGFVFSGQRLVEHLNIRFYNESIDATRSKEKVLKAEKEASLKAIWSRMREICAGGKLRLLDYGAGWGDFLAIAKSDGAEVYGLEYDQRKIDFANQQGIPCGDNDFVRDHAPYDAFFCNQVLEHLHEPKSALDELRTLLKPGAIGFVSVPYYPIEKVDAEVASLRSGSLPSKNFDPLGHLNYFSPQSLREMLSCHGFEEMQPRDHKPKSRLRRLMGRSKQRAAAGTSLFVRAA